MNDDLLEESALGGDLKTLVAHRKFKRFMDHIDEVMQEGLNKFVSLTPKEYTEFVAFKHKAEYQVMKELKDWMEDSIRRGNHADQILHKENTKG